MRAAISLALLIALGSSAIAGGRKPAGCAAFHLDPSAHEPLDKVAVPPRHVCVPCGFLLPDPTCSPGAVNPTVTIEVLHNKKFRTGCIRDGATSAAQKNQTYAWYNIAKPKRNTGKTQTCELDHIIPLQLGGADTLENIWPQCGPKGVKLARRYFKLKDAVENYLAKAVRNGIIDLETAQHGIAEDWTQFLHAAME